MRKFKDAGVDQVSPGALGMFLQGVPYDARDLDPVVRETPTVDWQGEWLVLRPATKDLSP